MIGMRRKTHNKYLTLETNIAGKNNKRRTQKIHEKEQQIETSSISKKDINKGKQNREYESKISRSTYIKEMGNNVIKGNVGNTSRSKNKPSKKKMLPREN